MRIPAIYLLTAAMFAALVATAGPVARYLELLNDGVETTGTVVVLTCSNHSSFRYSFIVGTQTFDGVGYYGIAKPCASLTSGEPVTVFYLLDDPSISTSGSPKDAIPNELFVFGFAVVALAIIGAWAYVKGRRTHAA